MKQRTTILLAAIFIPLSFLLSLISNSFTSASGWDSFLAVLCVAGLLVWLSWRLLAVEAPPRWLLWLTIAAAALRLVLGVVWFLALPTGGYDTDIQRAGYVMEDAFHRDQAAWDLAQLGAPLVSAFQGASSTDQYGGLLFFSAGIYRYLGSDQHQPLLMLVLTAAVSALAVALTWAFSRKLWGDDVARVAAWGVAFFPEAVLLGSSQMREAFTVTLVPLAIYGLLRTREELNVRSLAILVLPVLISVPLTWAFTPALLLLMALVSFSLDEWRVLKRRSTWMVLLAGLAALAIIGLLFFDLGNSWLVQSARWQSYVSANASGWIARQFERLPLFAQVPFLVGYGVVRPLLPAALVDLAPPIWTAIGIWRALGWTVLLALLLYASYLSLRARRWRQPIGAVLLSGWIITTIASYRAGGDLWDNPRYRSAFAAIHVAAAAWAWIESRRAEDPWLRRAAIMAAALIAWFIPWYLRRYTDLDWPIVNLDQAVGVGLVTAGLFVIWDWLSSLSSRA
jgi:hypothetical protein